ncbi:MAG: ATP-binding protein [Candidatus Methylumidiphilus sp.]
MTNYKCPFIFLWMISTLYFGMVSGAESGFRATLNPGEIAWLNAHPVIRFTGDPDYAPVEFTDAQGQYRGMGSDYLGLVAARLGIRFEKVAVNSFYEALKQVRDGQADLLPVVAETQQRNQYLLFTVPYLRFPAVVITARQDVENWSLEALRTMKIAVVHGYNWEDWLTHEYPDVDLVQAPDIQTALMSTSFGLADVMIGDIATTTYFIGKTNIANLRVVHQLEQNLKISMAVRSDLPTLRSLLDKSLANISEEEKRAIAKTWIRLEPPAWWKNPTFQRVAWFVLGALGFVILATLTWNRALARKVRYRTLALEEAHQRLIQSAKLESVGRLAAGVAHEVKNPLAILQMGVDFLAADIQPGSDAADVVKDMEDAIHRADVIIKGLLDFSRDKNLAMRKTDINEVLRDSLKLVNYEMNHHNIIVEEALSLELPAINADPDKLKQVFINLFMNAIQAMGRDGKLMVASESRRLKKEAGKGANATGKFGPGDRVIVIKVEDTGPGIDPAKVGQVFDPFFTTKPVGQGTGLGLSVSRTIVELHGGVISLRNRDGGGASVVLMFKIA